MKISLRIITLAISFSAMALETDNYLAWKIDLKDSVSHVNEYFKKEISESLRSISGQKSCEKIVMTLGKNFSSHLVHDNPVENWLLLTLNSEEIFPDHLDYVGESIYQDPFRSYIPWFGLAPNIQLNGFYLGTDKLSHFASTGMIYYRIFLKEKQRGRTDEEAERRAIDWGIRDEKSVHGFWSSGVFSYSDLEANYQGLKFYRQFCEGRQSFLEKNEQGVWIMRSFPDLRKYVSAHWDETFELSYLLPENWTRVKPVLQNYCSLRTSARVQARRKMYQLNRTVSFSWKYLDELKGTQLPDPNKEQSFSELCSGK